jgi:uncharacterized protein DUF4085
MIFFTRKLYEGYQPNSGWERRALNTWHKLDALYQDYRKLIAPLVPKSIVELDGHGLHDAVITSCSMANGKLTIVLDATNALSKWRGKFVTLHFTGVINRVPTRSIKGQWWLYSELHLSSAARFSLQVMLTGTDLQIDADDVRIETAKIPARTSARM